MQNAQDNGMFLSGSLYHFFFLYISCIIIFIYISIFLSFLIFENFLSFQFVMYSYFNSEKVEYRGVFRNQLNIYDGAF